MQPPIGNPVDRAELFEYFVGLAAGNSNRQHLSYMRGQFDRLATTYELVLRHTDADSHVLSVGGGAAYVEIALRAATQCSVTIIDFPEALALHAELYERHGLRSIGADLTSEDLGIRARFDILMHLEVIEHVPEAPAAQLARLRPLVTEGGHVFVSTPNASSLTHILNTIRAQPSLPLPEYTFSPVNYDNEWVHRREYFPIEIERAFRAADIAPVEKLYCWMPAPKRLDPKELLERLVPRLRPTILVHGIADSGRSELPQATVGSDPDDA